MAAKQTPARLFDWRALRAVACAVALASGVFAFAFADISFAMGMGSPGAGMRSGAGMARMPVNGDRPSARVPGRGKVHRYVGRTYPGGWSGPGGGDQVVVVNAPRNAAKARKQTKKATATAALPSGFFLPPAGETRFVPDEVILGIGAEVPEPQLDALALRHTMTREETQDFPLTGKRMHRWRLAPGGSVTSMIRGLSREPLVASAQPNYLYTLQQDTAVKAEVPTGDPAQYVIAKLRLLDAHRVVTGARVPVAVIDSGIDDTQPELAGAIAAKFDTLTAADERPQPHGTEMAGAIAAHGRLLGVAPRASLLAVRAFSASAGGGEGTTFRILRGLDWAAGQGARVVNMSFAGPRDPALAEALAKARTKGIVLVAAAGNAGPTSPPLFPAADPNVIAVTATDVDDKLFAQANRGDYIAIAAPGVDILVPAPDANVTFTSGTSVAAAHVSGLAALLIEAKPSLGPDDVRKILASSARKLGPKPRAAGLGAGLADALAAVTLAAPAAAKSTAGEQAAGQ